MRNILWVSVVSLALCACTQAFDDQWDVNGQVRSIIDGTDSSDDPGVLFIIADGALCTGALVAPRVVLTAKHCILGLQPFEIEVGAGDVATLGGSYAEVIEIRTTPGNGIDGQDIAVLILDEAGNLPTYDWVTGNDEEPEEGDTITAIGFGQQEVGPSGTGEAGEKQFAQTTILQLYDTEFIIDGPTTCFGDSGGPALLEDGKIFGVVSRGVKNCDGVSLYTRTDAFSGLINAAILSTGERIRRDSTEEAKSPSGGAVLSSTGSPLDESNDTVDSGQNPATETDAAANSQPAVPQQGEAGCAVRPGTTDSALWLLGLCLLVGQRKRRS